VKKILDGIMIKEISDFIYSFKNKIVEADEVANKYGSTITEFVEKIKKDSLDTQYEENFYTILGYTYRLEDISQRLFFTFQEAVYAIDLDKLMRNEDSVKVNSIVYILVLNEIIKEYKTKEENVEQKEKALEVYKKIEQRKAKENKKYHMYQN
jgi:Na+/phosphate symporter